MHKHSATRIALHSKGDIPVMAMSLLTMYRYTLPTKITRTNLQKLAKSKSERTLFLQ